MCTFKVFLLQKWIWEDTFYIFRKNIFIFFKSSCIFLFLI